MELSDEQIYGLRVRSGMDAFRPMKEHWQAKDDDAAYLFARAIEAEVRKQDEAMQIDYARLHAISIDYSDAEDECTGFRDGWRSAEKYHGITKGGQHGD